MSAQIDRNSELGAWERSNFAMTVAELEIHECLMTIARLLDGSGIGPTTRRALSLAAEALRAEMRRES